MYFLGMKRFIFYIVNHLGNIWGCWGAEISPDKTNPFWDGSHQSQITGTRRDILKEGTVEREREGGSHWKKNSLERVVREDGALIRSFWSNGCV